MTTASDPAQTERGSTPAPYPLHPYQRQAVAQTYAAIRAGARRPLIVMPVGTGKTITFAQIVHDCTVVKARPSLVVAHREELIDQAVAKIHHQTGLRPAVEKAERRASRNPRGVVVGCVPTMRGTRLESWNRGTFGVAVIDECHHAASASYRVLIDYFGGSEDEGASGEFVGAPVVGVTATPDRGDGKNLGEVFDAIAFNYPLTTAVTEGYLCRPRFLVVEDFCISLASARVSHGDYVASDLDALLMPQLDLICDAIVEHSRDRKRTLIFAPLVRSAQAIRDKLVERGIRADEVNGETPRDERREKLERFRRGETTHMANCMVLTEGYDHPAIDCIVNCRPTRSRGLFVQMLGRGTRVLPGKKDVLLINFDFENAHDLVSPYELFIDDDIGEEVRAVAELLPMPGPGVPIDPMERLLQAIKRRHDPDVLRDKLTLREYDPLDLVRLAGKEPDSELNIRWRNPVNGRTYHLSDEPGTASKKQLGLLRRLGMGAVHGELSKAQASLLIDTITEFGRGDGAFDRARDGLFERRQHEIEEADDD